MVIKLCERIYCFKTIFLLNLHTLFVSRSYDKIIEILEGGS